MAERHAFKKYSVRRDFVSVCISEFLYFKYPIRSDFFTLQVSRHLVWMSGVRVCRPNPERYL